jgi:proteasome alpha subunit
MMLEEPYRWAEAIANRREYVEDQLRGGSPVVGIGYEDGALLLTLGQGQQKVFEVYDRIGMASLGHPTDIEKLREAAIDLAHTIGFNYSEADVTLQQIVHFGLGPAVKTAFDEIFRSPYIARTLLAELDGAGGGATFYTVDYDGVFQRSPGSGALADMPEADQVMHWRLEGLEPSQLSLAEALDAALLTWAAGRWVGKLDEIPREEADLREAAQEADLEAALKEELQSLAIEAVVLDCTRPGKSAYRNLDDEEIRASAGAYL